MQINNASLGATSALAMTPSNKPSEGSERFVLDLNAIESVKVAAKHDPKVGIKQVASQFEAMFLNTLLQTMRQNPMGGEEEDSGGALGTYQGLYDQQLTQKISGNGGMGIAAALEKQLAKAQGIKMDGPGNKNISAGVVENSTRPVPQQSWSQLPAKVNSTLEAALAKVTEPKVTVATEATVTPSTKTTGASGDFARTLLPHATQAGKELGVEPQLVVAHAALESGWGKKPIRHSDGRDSHNLFSIKAGGSWKGNTVDITTTEYIDGAPQKRVERFRSYGSYQEAFTDYAKLIKNNPRYQGALNQGSDAVGFARGLARGGYATDPHYANKLSQLAAGVSGKPNT